MRHGATIGLKLQIELMQEIRLKAELKDVTGGGYERALREH